MPALIKRGGYMTEKILELKEITKRFPGVLALDHVQLEVEQGEVLALCGENGAGKSTLMKVLLGSYQADEGTMFFKGQPYRPKSPSDALNMGISMIHQEISLVHTMTVTENIWIGREGKFTRNGLIDTKKQKEATQKLLDEYEISLNPDTIVSHLSIANMQLVEILRAISYDSDVIIMDEPTSALTNKEVDKLYHIIRTLSEKGTAVIYISHKLDEVFEISDRITVLRDGKYITTCQTDSTDEDQLVSLMVGRELSDVFRKEEVKLGEVVFEVEGFCRKGYFKDINFQVRRGEVLGFCGLMGSGRTEIMQAIYAIDKADSGMIRVNGKEVKIHSPKDAIRNRIGMVTEDRLRKGVIHHLPVKTNMTLAYLDSVCKSGFIDFKREQSDFEKYAKALNIKYTSGDQEIGVLSGGNQQKVIIGKWLLTDPEVLILDEPTRGIDVGAKAEIYRLINELAAQGKAIIIVSSELPELMGVSDRILVIHQGAVTGELNREGFDEKKIMTYAFGINKKQKEEA